MTTNISSYLKYRDSKIEWLGEIPGDWKILAFKQLFTLFNERVKDNPSIDLPLSVSGYRGVEPREVVSMEGQMPSENVNEYRIVKKGQLAVNTMWLNYTGLGVSEYEGYISPAYRAYSIKPEINKKYVHYLLRSSLYVQKYTSMLYGIRPNSLQVKAYDFERIEILFPSLGTQQQIVDFLDEKTKIIANLITKKELLIILLKEKRASIITHAVTKGLNPKSKMKSSGVEWTGDIPKAWELKKAKYIFREVKRDPLDNDEIITAFRDGVVTLRRNRREEGFTNALKEIGYQKILKGDLVIHAMDAFAGAIGVSDTTGKGSPVYSVCVPIFQVNVDYFGALIRSMALSGYISSLSRGIRVRSTDFRFVQFKELKLLIPSYEEQQKISDYIISQTLPIDQVINKIQLQIDILNEYNSSLINSAVTGKIKV